MRKLLVCLALAASAVAGAAHGAALGVVPPAAVPTTPTVTSSVVTVSNRQYTVYDHADPATKKFCVVTPRV